MRLKSTLEQWITLQEVDKSGSIQAAAASLNKSHTTLIYSIKKLEAQLGIKLLEISGRRAILTKHAKSLLRRAESMIEQARDLEAMSQQLSVGVESEITIAMDHLCDPTLLYKPMKEFLKVNTTTSIQIIETSLSKTSEMVTDEEADIAIITLPVTNYPAQVFSLTTMIPVVSITHPLAAQDYVCIQDLAIHSQIVIRDLGRFSSTFDGKNVGWLKANQRITVDNFDHAFRATEQGLGFCRLPEHIIRKRYTEKLKIIKVEHNEKYQVPLHITLPKRSKTGLAARTFYEILLRETYAFEHK
ncbi:LysR family transcriptional regulator [Pseudoalteromonas shioyasakiensis]|uniref:LysR family transcriptional regulator n=1 Tax=Pseudoalteromonas shioyasakiensis TaxID=1190813 RepID=UPI001EFCD6EF|nr:LysR family transcriptional regulator [Pseudoalteromonas shioyasakiensis]MCG9733843.1 LysR family transcriptional regulator [Pseudoalteromonas shioyasakiensis]